MSKNTVAVIPVRKVFADVLDAYTFALCWNKESVYELEHSLQILRNNSKLRYAYVLDQLKRAATEVEEGVLLAIDEEGLALILANERYSVIDYKKAA